MRRGLDVQVALDGQRLPVLADRLQFFEREVAELAFMADDQAKEKVLAIELNAVMPSTGLCRVGRFRSVELAGLRSA